MTQQKKHQAESDVTNDFRKHALSMVKIRQSRFMAVNGRKYAVVGQYTSLSPFMSHYDVFDEDGTRADDETARMVYAYISRPAMMNQIASLKILLEHYQESEHIESARELEEGFREETGHDIKALVQENKTLTPLFVDLLKKTQSIMHADEWKVEDFRVFDEAWDAFWGVYEERMKVLFAFRHYITEHHANIKVAKTYMHPFYLEADMMFDMFSETIPLSSPLITNVDDFIQLQGQLGRVESDEESPEVLTGFDRFSRSFFSKAYKIILAGVLPVTLLLGVLDVFSYKVGLSVFLVGMVFLAAEIADKPARLKLVAERYQQLRGEKVGSQPIIRNKYRRAYDAFQAKVEKRRMEEKPFEFKAGFGRLMRWLVGIGLFIFIIGAGTIMDGEAFEYSQGYVYVGLTILMIRILLPHTPVGKRRIQLWRDKLVLGKRRHYTEDHIEYIKINKRGSILTIQINGMPQTLKYKIRKADRQAVRKQLRIWSDRNHVRWEEK